MIELKIDNRYKDGRIVKRGNRLIGNKKTLAIEKIENPANPLSPILMVSEPLASMLKRQVKR